MKHINFLIKPASGLCNMRCKYCFYEDEIADRTTPLTEIMTKETTDILLREAFNAVDSGSEINFSFQGGEPTLAGLSYFQYFISAAKKLNEKQVKINYSIQTNGLNIDEAWVDFLVENHFLIGLSMDGDQFHHDLLRTDSTGKGTWARVHSTLMLLKKKHAEVNILCVVTKQCAKHPEQIYHSLKNLGIGYIQFIACLDPLEATRGSMPYSLSPQLYGRFLCGVFDEWYQDWKQGKYVSIRLFDDYVHLIMGLPAGTCATSGTCGAYFVVEGDGSLYPCDFYCLDEWKLGKLGDKSLELLTCQEKEKQFLQEGSLHPLECNECSYYRLCFGGCKRDWVQDQTGKHNYFCSSFRQFFRYAGNRLLKIAQAEQQYYGSQSSS